jgi:hypothetical protein
VGAGPGRNLDLTGSSFQVPNTGSAAGNETTLAANSSNPIA